VLAVSEIHLLQLFQNIIGNAIKYRSSVPPSIRIWAELDTGGWDIWIRDNGIGINPKYSELIFGYFQRLHAASEYVGSGLGLATCRKIVERLLSAVHEHRVCIDS
jgi:light-regulated signal transduction histidine kinase (bacteriophytochrome)